MGQPRLRPLPFARQPDQAASFGHTQVLGPEFEQRFSSNDLLQMEAIVGQAVGPVKLKQNTITFLQAYFQQIQQVRDLDCRICGSEAHACAVTLQPLFSILAVQAGIKAFCSFEVDICYAILELLYTDGGGQFKGTIERGGKLMAGEMVAAGLQGKANAHWAKSRRSSQAGKKCRPCKHILPVFLLLQRRSSLLPLPLRRRQLM